MFSGVAVAVPFVAPHEHTANSTLQMGYGKAICQKFYSYCIYHGCSEIASIAKEAKDGRSAARHWLTRLITMLGETRWSYLNSQFACDAKLDAGASSD